MRPTITLSRETYHAAFREACDEYRRIQSRVAAGQQNLSAQDADLGLFLAAIYDNSTGCNILGTLATCDAARRDLLLTLVVGRALHGRPLATSETTALALSLSNN